MTLIATEPLPREEAFMSAPLLRMEPYQAKILLRGRAANPAFLQAVKETLGFDLPLEANRSQRRVGAGTLLWLSPTGWLLVAPSARAISALTERLDGSDGEAIDVSDEYDMLSLTGDTDMLLASVCAIDLSARRWPPGTVVRTLVAGVPAIVYRRHPEIVRLYVDRSLSHHVCESLESVARDLD